LNHIINKKNKKGDYRKMKLRLKNQAGFTLIEMLIVVIVLGILAMIIIPQVSVSTADARLNALKTNLNALRSSIELYYFQHDNKYPGSTKETDGNPVGSDADAAKAFVPQLTKYSDLTGKTADVKGGNAVFGPYVKAATLPTNPYNDKNDVVCDYDESDITKRSSAGENFGWKFYPVTGILIPADNGAHDTL
jgi:prepilin-type N-terminal cleavage/methylation domain-containing protein